ncbi:MAG: DUF885 domain-containing protein [Myxococcales bacterium]|nr:DUF885 domain-containing protein [Myxococcales bacterium]
MKIRALAVLLAIGCTHASPPAPATPDFATFVDGYYKMRFARLPSLATRVGLHDGDANLEDLSRAGIETRIAELKDALARLQAIRRGPLSFDEDIDAQLIEYQIRGTLLDQEQIRLWERSPMGYVSLPGGSIDGLMKRDFAPARGRLESVIARLKQVPRIYADAKENVKDPPKEFTDLAVRMSRGSVGFFEKAVTSWAHEAAGGDAELQKQFDEAQSQAAAATRDFAGWLQTDLLPRSHGQYAIGAEKFLAKLKYDDMVELPLPELLAKGEAQLAKDHAAFVETARRVDATKTPEEVMKTLSDVHPTADDLIPSVARSVEAAREFVVAHDLVTVPSEVRVKVEQTPPYARSGSFASMDTPGPFETTATEAFYYVTPVEQDWDAKHKEEHLRLYNPWVVGMINVHEAYPGHYLEFLYAPRFPTKVRKLSHSSTNSEGWAHYCEQMTVEHGFGGGDPKMQLAQLSEALLRDCRYITGIQLHTGGWTVEQGARLFREQCFQEPANAFEEARRGTYNPTYLYYTLGKLMIQDLARDYMREKHASLKQFHDAFVGQGALPIPLVRKILLRP